MSKLTDLGFPLLKYRADKTLYQCGLEHGEQLRQGITELALIRKELMLAKSPWLKENLDELALEQFESTKAHFPKLAAELEGIAKGSTLSLSDIVILNNYTDFRDIKLADQGCSTIYFARSGNFGAGQTWDMHGSAKNYMTLLHLEEAENRPEALILTLAGCTGLMGINRFGVFLGVNNINTHHARPAVIWPALVRATLEQPNYQQAKQLLTKTPVTSGHNYLLAQGPEGSHFEISPDLVEEVATLCHQEGLIFHVNHCLGSGHKEREDALSANSTSLIREEILQRLEGQVRTGADLKALLQSHDNYPKSICSHAQSDQQDPSLTCAGGVFAESEHKLVFWRGCPQEDRNYREYNFSWSPKTSPAFSPVEE